MTSPSRATARSPQPSSSNSPFSMAARTGTNRLPPEAFAAFTFDPTNSSADSAETDSPEVTLREDHDQDHLPQDTDHETLLHELAELGCTEITLGILANNQINRQLWLTGSSSAARMRIRSFATSSKSRAAYREHKSRMLTISLPLLLRPRTTRLCLLTTEKHEPSTSTSQRSRQLILARPFATEELTSNIGYRSSAI